MDALLQEHEKLASKSNLSKTIEDVQKTIDLLSTAREYIAANESSASITLAKLQNPAKQSFDNINSDLKEIYNGLGRYQKALDKYAKPIPLPTTDYDALSSHPNLVNRAIAMHLLREGQFSVASTFLAEATANPPMAVPTPGTPNPYDASGQPLDVAPLSSESLQQHFTDMYHILNEMRNRRNLLPARLWARLHREVLEGRGSNLEFELGRLQFVWLFMGSGTGDRERGVQEALEFARTEFGGFQGRYLREIKQLCGAFAFETNLALSPYHHIFHDPSAWDEVARSFTREFCSVLGLSADSPLYIAATAGAIALPTLLKMASIMKDKRTEWTTQDELPVETPLPQSYQFHSIFVCPVSKEQSTEQNPPMMMPCGHVIAQESLMRISKGTRFKCPYCPCESQPADAKRVFL
ncbi:MAG: ASTRA complex subunit [Watsoniomyces obsoletus]|nr:MAG: ASTRA complex subunit [Watsoniomyces obsoletus]